ncbi:MAG: hypothetical protein HPY73_05860 [Methanomassiliicoccales archaeon]|nr:MAG: hypothetical protein HPY73_05860 [Methanomassiliicoccales archaeon]
MREILKLMMLEEYRLHVSYSSRRVFLTLPLYVIIFTVFFGSTVGVIRSISIEEMVVMAHGGMFLYGMSVGAFGFLGRTSLERRYGKNSYLVTTPFLLPLSFRRAYFAMFLRDLVFYSVLILVPALFGLTISALIAGYRLTSVFLLFMALFLSFLLGISFSFFVSVVYTRSIAAFLAVILVTLSSLIAYGVFDILSIDILIPSIGLQMNVQPFGEDVGMALLFGSLSITASLIFAAMAVVLVSVEREGRTSSYDDQFSIYSKRLKVFRPYDALLAKELVDILRSGLASKLVFAYGVPLLFLGLSTWYINTGLRIPVGFNIVFYAGMVGFFGIMVYNWLTNTDLNDYFETMPVSVPTVIKTKLMAFLLITTGTSAAFVVLIAIINGETRLLWLALPVLFVTSFYMVTATAYLTGLRTSSFLFDPSVVAKFAMLAMVPDIAITILSFSVDSSPTLAAAGILLALLLLGVATRFFYTSIDKRWSSEPFA